MGPVCWKEAIVNRRAIVWVVYPTDQVVPLLFREDCYYIYRWWYIANCNFIYAELLEVTANEICNIRWTVDNQWDYWLNGYLNLSAYYFYSSEED